MDAVGQPAKVNVTMDTTNKRGKREGTYTSTCESQPWCKISES